MVDGDNCLDTKNILDVLYVTEQVGQASAKSIEVLFVQIGLSNAAVVLKGTSRCNNNHSTRIETRHAAFDIKEFLGTEVGTEPSLRNRNVAKAQSHARCHDRVASMGNVRKGPTMYKSRRVLERLDQIGL